MIKRPAQPTETVHHLEGFTATADAERSTIGDEHAEAVHAFYKTLGLQDKNRLPNHPSRDAMFSTKLGGGRKLVPWGELTGRDLLSDVVRELRPLGLGGHLVSLVCTAI